MELSQFIAREKVIEVEFPTISEWKIQIAHISRDETQKLLEKCSTVKFSKITHQREEITDNNKFLKLFTERTIKDWSGLKRKHLASLMVLEDEYLLGHEEEEVEYSPENAYVVLSNSVEVDRFINDVLRNVEEFNVKLKKTTIKN